MTALDEAEAEFAAGKTRTLDEVLRRFLREMVHPHSLSLQVRL
jgi:hypothetical protein